MGIITSMRRQVAVYWAVDGCDKYGKPKYCAPCEVPCRYQSGVVEFIDEDGVTVYGVATVFPDRNLDVGGMVLEGLIKDVVTDVSNPYNNPGAVEIVQTAIIPNLKNTEILYKVICDNPTKRN